MKNTPVLWVIICCLTIQVSSSSFDKNNSEKTAIEENLVINTDIDNEQTGTKLVLKKDQDSLITDMIEQDKIVVLGNEKEMKNPITSSEPTEAKKNFIHDGQSDLTEDQQHIVYAALSPMVKQLCRAQSTSAITRLIAAFLWHRHLPEQRVGTIPHDRSIRMCQLSSDDSWLVSHSLWQLYLWNVATNRLQWTLTAHDEDINQCILSSDDQYIISASRDKTLKIWTFLSGTLLYTLEGHTGRVSSCSLSADNQFLLSTSDDETVRMWSVTTGKCIKIFYGHSTHAKFAQFYANNPRVISTCRYVRVWDVATKKCVQILQGHTDVITYCNYSSDEQFLLSGSTDETARVWDLSTGTCKQTFEGHTDCVEAGCFVRNDTWIASIDYKNNLCIWRISDAHCVYRLPNYYAYFSLQRSYWLKCRNTECIIVSTYTTNPYNHIYPIYEVHVLSVESGEKIFTIQSHDAPVRTACVSSDGRYLFSGDSNGTIKVVAFAKK